MKRACLVASGLACALGACMSDPDPVEYTGEPRRFVVDSIAVPTSSTTARELGLDITGDHTIDNQLGMVLGVLGSVGNVTTHGDDMIAAGVIASSVELVADDLRDDDTVALRYFGSDGASAELVGGALAGGRFVTTRSGSAMVRVPALVDADPIELELRRLHVELVADGHGGFDAKIGGAIAPGEVRAAAFAAIQQMIAARPRDHVALFRMLDAAPHDFTLTQDELEANQLIQALLAPDIVRGGKATELSFGFRVHLSPCAEGTCRDTEPAPTCFDRVHNGSETDVDCGGACGACGAGFGCAAASDCESAACDGGACAEASCDNGVRDGFETDVDCGTACGPCSAGQACWTGDDCTSGQCGAPCSGWLCSTFTLDTCRS